MNTPQVLAFAGTQHDRVKKHLFPGDGLEAAAILLCSRSASPRVRLLVRDILLIPHEECRLRQTDRISWPGTYIEEAIDRAEAEALTVILIHSHPGGLFEFSMADDLSDQETMPGLLQNHGSFHCTAIMTPDGAIRGRYYSSDLVPQAIPLVTVAGHDLQFWWDYDATAAGPGKRPIAFTSAMTAQLSRLTAMVVGVSGTGSIVAEQLLRLGFGKVKLVDFDVMKLKNLNRILNSTLQDARAERSKVEMFAEAAAGYRGVGVAEAIPNSILTREAVIAAGQCDVPFCCVDSLEARQIMDLISQSFILPIFDVGVVIPVRKTADGPAIGDVCGRIDYVQPGRSTLQDRSVYSPESLRAEYLRHNAPEAHRQELEAGYIKGLIEEAPAVISLNMRAAAGLVNEFIARAFPFRHEVNSAYARTQFSLAACEEEFTAEIDFPASASSAMLGRGSKEPLLGMPFLAPPPMSES